MILGSSHGRHFLLLIGFLALLFSLMLAKPVGSQFTNNAMDGAGLERLNAVNSTGPVSNVYIPLQARQTEESRLLAARYLARSEANAVPYVPAPATPALQMARPVSPDDGTAGMSRWLFYLSATIIVFGLVGAVFILGAWTRHNRPPSHRPTLPRDHHRGLPI